VTLLVGQQAVVDLQMGVSGVAESVTVTGQAPVLDVTQSTLGGNVDPRQMQELPVQGRNWIDLIALAPGAGGNSVSEKPTNFGGPSEAMGLFALNVDGQAVTQLLSASGSQGQPRFSKDAIEEFEFVSSRFDATQGRSTGIQVNAITKSGTNTPSGTVSGYFRHDRLNAADHVARRVLPYENQQISTTFGGPIRKDRVHFFANYEYEREPHTAIFTTRFPHFNQDLHSIRTEPKAGVKLDSQFSPQTRLSVRWSGFWGRTPVLSGGSGNSAPTTVNGRDRNMNQLLATLTQVLSNRAVNEVKVGYADFTTETPISIQNPNSKFFRPHLGGNAPRILLRGLTLGGTSFFPQDNGQEVYSVRDDLTYTLTKGGRHTVKLGGEYLHQNVYDFRCTICDGELTANRLPVPANIESLFPDIFDASTWNLAPLSALSTRWRQPFGSSFLSTHAGRDSFAGWMQDDWTITPRLTLNLGVRYDLELNAFVNDVAILPFRPAGQPEDTNNIAPRLGFSFSANDRTVLRGGYGIYYGTTISAYATDHAVNTLTLEVRNDSRPNFASNPFNGPEPTYESLLPRICTPALAPGCIRREFTTTGAATIFAPGFTMPYSHQGSIGVQRQLGDTMAVEADYVYIGGRHHPANSYDNPINLTYNPATGANYPFSDISRRPFPDWGFIRFNFGGSRSNAHALQTAFTKRFSHAWQASGTYTLGVVRDALPRPRTGLDLVPFPTAPDLGGEYGLSEGDQRHRAVFNGIWQLGYGFQLSGLYFFGSGEREAVIYGADLRQLGYQRGERRLRPDILDEDGAILSPGTIIPRNYFVGDPIHRVDLRIQRRFALGSRARIDGIVELFNVFNRANYGGYVLDEASPNFGEPQGATGVAYAPRMAQLGVRFAF
jgi:hypothetical protein